MEYAAPTTVDEARTLLADNPVSRVFARATDVVPQMRSGRPEPSVLIDQRIDRLMSVTHDGHWTIGAAMPTSKLTSNGEFSRVFPQVSRGATDRFRSSRTARASAEPLQRLARRRQRPGDDRLRGAQ